jgi:hypothetical protein
MDGRIGQTGKGGSPRDQQIADEPGEPPAGGEVRRVAAYCRDGFDCGFGLNGRLAGPLGRCGRHRPPVASPADAADAHAPAARLAGYRGRKAGGSLLPYDNSASGSTPAPVLIPVPSTKIAGARLRFFDNRGFGPMHGYAPVRRCDATGLRQPPMAKAAGAEIKANGRCDGISAGY